MLQITPNDEKWIDRGNWNKTDRAPISMRPVDTGRETPRVLTEKLDKHIKLCTRNIKSDRVKCCAQCPFELIITQHNPELGPLFTQKRKKLEQAT